MLDFILVLCIVVALGLIGLVMHPLFNFLLSSRRGLITKAEVTDKFKHTVESSNMNAAVFTATGVPVTNSGSEDQYTIRFYDDTQHFGELIINEEQFNELKKGDEIYVEYYFGAFDDKRYDLKIYLNDLDIIRDV